MSVFIFPYVYISPLPLFLFISSLWIALIIFYSCVNITAMREYKEWKSRAEIRSDWVILTCFLSLSLCRSLSPSQTPTLLARPILSSSYLVVSLPLSPSHLPSADPAPLSAFSLLSPSLTHKHTLTFWRPHTHMRAFIQYTLQTRAYAHAHIHTMTPARQVVEGLI